MLMTILVVKILCKIFQLCCMFEILHNKISEELNDSLKQCFRLGIIVPLVHRRGNYTSEKLETCSRSHNRQKPSPHPPHLLSGRLPFRAVIRMQTPRADSPVPPGIKRTYFISKIGKNHCRKRGVGAPQRDIPVSLGG